MSWSARSTPPPGGSAPSTITSRRNTRSCGRCREPGAPSRSSSQVTVEAEQVRQREHVRAAARSADLLSEPPGERVVEPRPGQRADAIHGITAALAARRRGRLEGHRGLACDDVVEETAGRIDDGVEQHVMHDAGRLQLTGHGNEAALAQVDQLPAHVEAAVRSPRQGDGQRSRVERMTAQVQVHRGHFGVPRAPGASLAALPGVRRRARLAFARRGGYDTPPCASRRAWPW